MALIQKDLLNKAPSVVLIDELALDKECVSLPTLILQYSNMAADARREVDETKADMSLVEAELARAVRDEPGKYGLEKVTEGALKEVVQTLPAYKKAQDACFAARHELDLVSAVVSALETKKRSLTLLVELHGAGYKSEVKVSPKGKAAVEEITKQAVRRHDYRRDTRD